MDENSKKNIRESLAHSISTSLTVDISKRRALLLARSLITEFYHSLKRKHMLENCEVEDEIKAALERLEELGEMWNYVASP